MRKPKQIGARLGIRPSAVLFDLDGTLVDTLDDVTLAINDALARKGLPAIGRDVVCANLGAGGMAMANAAVTCACANAPADLISEVHALYMEKYRGGLAVCTRLYPGAADILVNLSAGGLATALCTNKVTELTMPLLHALGLDSAFDVIVCGDTLQRKKPSPDQIWYVLDRLRIGSSSAVMVGDTAIDREAAEAASVAFIHARYGYGGQLLPASLCIESLNELEEIALGSAALSLHA